MVYGPPGVVKSRCRKLAKKLLASNEFRSFDPGPMLDTAEAQGFLLVDSSPLIPTGDHFHCNLLTQEIFEACPAKDALRIVNAWVTGSLSDPWRFLGVQMVEMAGAVDEGGPLAREFVEAAARFWPLFTSQGNRFGPFVNEPHDAWQVMRNLRNALIRLGIPWQDVKPTPAEGPAEFLRRLDEQREST